MQNQNQNSNVSIEDLLKEHKDDLKKSSQVSAPQKDKTSQIPPNDPKKEDVNTDLPDPSKVAEQVNQKIKPKSDVLDANASDNTEKKVENPEIFFESKGETEKKMGLDMTPAIEKEDTTKPLVENGIEDAKLESLKKLDESDIRKKIERLEAELNERNNIEKPTDIEIGSESSSDAEPGLKKPNETSRNDFEDAQKTDLQSPLPEKLNIDVLAKLPKEDQVRVLTKVVYKDGLYKAINTATRLDDPYLMDLLHDTLVDELYAKLKAGKKN